MIRLMVMNGLLICLMLIWISSASEPAKQLLGPQAETITRTKDDPQISPENSKVYEFVLSISAQEKVMFQRKIHPNSHAINAKGIVNDSNRPSPALKSGGQRLLFSTEKLSWVDAQKDCKARGGALASLGDKPQDVFDHISANFRWDSFWLGGSDIKTEGTWLWLNGNPIDLTKHWRRNEPNNGGRNEDCMWLIRGEYLDRSCAYEYQYICDLDSTDNIPFHERTQHLFFSEDRMYWEDAMKDCEAKQGTLAILENEPEDVFTHIGTHYAGVALWLGGSDIVKEGDWVWLNGDPIDLTKYWRRNEPNNWWGGEDCLEYYYGYNDRSCRRRNRYICNLAQITTTSAPTTLPPNTTATEDLCTDNMYQCSSGKCIFQPWLCDGENDCLDGADELDCLNNKCSANQYQCTSRQCIYQTWLCDGENDCSDGADEQDCQKNICSVGQFQCSSGQCIYQTWLCDGENDCSDGADEQDCQTNTCVIDQYQCSSGQCINQTLACDSVKDCTDGTDEQDCQDNTCISGQFQCSSGQCIDQSWLCDTINDCPDMADEQDCQNNICDVGQIQCSSGQCIEESWVCDGIDDCPDAADEQDCQDNTCSEYNFKCQSGQCIDPTWLCDGDSDCTDGNDEQDCPEKSSKGLISEWMETQMQQPSINAMPKMPPRKKWRIHDSPIVASKSLESDDAKKNQDCSLRGTSATGSPPLLIIKTESKKNTYINHADSAKHGVEVTIVCPGSGNILIKGSTQIQNPSVLDCDDGKLFPQATTGKRTPVSITYYECRQNYQISIIKRSESCGKNNGISTESGTRYVIGYETYIKNQESIIFPLIDICFLKDRGTTFWTKHILQGDDLERKIASKNKPNFKPNEFPEPIKKHMTDIYRVTSQFRLFEELLGSKDIFCTGSGFTYLAKGHMVPRSDMIEPEEQDATYYFINALPQWQNINGQGGNWGLIERRIQEFAKDKMKKLTIYSGGHKVLGDPQKIYLGNYFKWTEYDKEKEKDIYKKEATPYVPVPEITWKIVLDKEENKGIAFIVVNNPFIKNEEIGGLNIAYGCGFDCNQITWLSNENNNNINPYEKFKEPWHGLTYCCEVSAFSNIYPHFNDLGINVKGMTPLTGVKAIEVEE